MTRIFFCLLLRIGSSQNPSWSIAHLLITHQSARNRNDLLDKPMDNGNCLIDRELVEQHAHVVKQLGSQLLYGKGDYGRMKQRSHQSNLITCLAEMLSQAAAK